MFAAGKMPLREGVSHYLFSRFSW